MTLAWRDFGIGGLGMWVIVDRLADVILSYVEGCIVEIGIGRSTYMLAKHSRDFGVKHYAIDQNPKKCKGIKADKKVAGENLVIYNGKSLDFLKDFDDTPAIVFIDGCHHYEVVKEEVAILLPKMPEGGVMFLHDTCLCESIYQTSTVYYEEFGGWFSDCYKVRLDLEKDDSVWCLTFPYSAFGCGLTLVLKKPKFEYRPDSLTGVHL